MSDTLQTLVNGLDGVTTEDGLTLSAELIRDEVSMVKVEVQDREEFPVYITMDDEQMLCTTHLWRENEIAEDKRTELLELMLTMNVPMPLSSFGKVGDQYLLFGALAAQSGIDEVRHEIAVLSDNTLGAIEALRDYLQ